MRLNNKEKDIKIWKQIYLNENRQIINQDKEIIKLFTFSINNQQWKQLIFKIISEYEINNTKQQKQIQNISKKLKDIYYGINDFKQKLKYYQETKDYLLQIQNISSNIYDKMTIFRNKMCNDFNQLTQIEEKYNYQLELKEKKIAIIINNQDYVAEKKVTTKKQVQNKLLNKQPLQKQVIKANDRQQCSRIQILQKKMKEKEAQVAEIEEEIRSLGKNLGWAEEDHQDFITIWNRCSATSKNYFDIQDQLCSYFNLYMGEQVQDHMNKYIKQKKLNETKKEYIYEYKVLKEQKKNQEIKALILMEKQEKAEQLEVDKEKKNEQQQLQMKHKIKEWKENKKLKEKQKEQQNRKKIQQEEKINRGRKIEQQQRKIALEQWKQQQEIIKQQRAKQSSKQKKKKKNQSQDQETEARIKKREEKLLEEKMALVLKKKMEHQQIIEKEEHLKELKYVKYAHINTKVEQMTKVMKEKQRSKFDGKEIKEADTFGGKLFMNSKAIPQWRKGL